MKLITFAKALQPFIQKGATLEAIYKETCSNKSIPFKDILKPIDLIKVVFIAKKISNGEDPKEIMRELDTNLFLFSTVEFGDNDQTIDCENCSGDGSLECTWCDGTGEEDCPECDGEGSFEVGDNEWEDCDECQGGGKVECNHCDGEGTTQCDYCNGDGYVYTDEYVPYEIGYYISYDDVLKTTLEGKLLRNDTENPELNSKKTFLISVNEVEIENGESGNIKSDFANTTHLLEINTDEVSEDLIYGNNRIIPSGFYDSLDKFM